MSSLPDPLGQPWSIAPIIPPITCQRSGKRLHAIVGILVCNRTGSMKINSSLALTLILLSFMFAVGLISGAGGYIFGRKALKGITQPAINPIPLGSEEAKQLPQQTNPFLQERDILAKVETQTKGVTKQAPEAKPKPTPTAPPQSTKPVASPAAQTFPLQSQDQGVTLEVRSLEVQSDGMQLEVALKNESSTPVQFLYTFLEVTDEQGRVYTAITRGLPAEIQPQSEIFSGMIKIPEVSSTLPKQLFLSLTNYPEQNLKLRVSHIPVVR